MRGCSSESELLPRAAAALVHAVVMDPSLIIKITGMCYTKGDERGDLPSREPLETAGEA